MKPTAKGLFAALTSPRKQSVAGTILCALGLLAPAPARTPGPQGPALKAGVAAVEPELMKHWEYCYAHTIGCVGILKDWLMRALDDALAEKARTITFKTLERHALSVDQCEAIATEALEGEARLTKDTRNSARLMQMLGFTKSPASQTASTASAKTDQKNGALTVKVNPRLPQPVGRRKPRRDAVGVR